MLKSLLLISLVAALITSCSSGTTTQTPVPAPAPMPTPVINLSGTYLDNNRDTSGNTGQSRLVLIDNNGKLTGTVTRTLYNNVNSPLGPLTLFNGSRSSDGKKAQWSFDLSGSINTWTYDFDASGNATGSSNFGNTGTLAKIQ